MPPRDWRFRVDDILQAIARIQRYTSGMSLETFAADERTVHAVERNREIIGEAARHVPVEVQARYALVPWRDMLDMRNVVTHAYFKIRVSILWDTVQHDLPPLVPVLREILEREA